MKLYWTTNAITFIKQKRLLRQRETKRIRKSFFFKSYTSLSSCRILFLISRKRNRNTSKKLLRLRKKINISFKTDRKYHKSIYVLPSLYAKRVNKPRCEFKYSSVRKVSNGTR